MSIQTEIDRINSNIAAAYTALAAKGATMPTTRNSANLAATVNSISMEENMSYPIGAVVITATNANPASDYGGTWELIDKEFKTQTVTPAIITGTVLEMDDAIAYLSGHSIQLTLNPGPPASAITDSDIHLFTVEPTSCGVVQFNDDSYRSLLFTDGGNSIINYYVGTAGGFYTVDIIVRGSSAASLAKNTELSIFTTAPIMITNIDYMLDSFCDKFYWKRTA